MTVYGPYSDVVSGLTLFTGGAPLALRVFLLQPEVIFAARVNLPDPAEYPISFVAYDTITVGDYTDIKPGMTLLLGSTPGGDQYGRQRVRGPETPATTISIFVGRSSRGTHDGELTLVDNAYLTIWDDRRLWAKIPFIDADGRIFKDSDLEVGDRTTDEPPVACFGAGYAATVDAITGKITVLFPGNLSYAVADGATIVAWDWDIADGEYVLGSANGDNNITVTFEPGFRYVRLTVTDSNGKTATSERPVLADDPDDRLSLDSFTLESHRITDAGNVLTLRALEDIPRATYPDGTLVMAWEREPSGAANRDHMLVVGWLDSEEAQIGATKTGLLRDTTLIVLDVGARLDQLPGFPQSIADDETRDSAKIPEITWNYMVNPTMDKYIHYLLAWHSTALEVADFVSSGTGSTYRIVIKNSDGESLWNQVARTAQAMCPGFVLTCDRAGRIQVVPNPNRQEPADRTDQVQASIDEDDWSDLRVTYQRSPRTHWLRTGAILVQDSVTFNEDGSLYLPTVFSIAPGDAPGQGLGEVDNNEQLAASQEALNNATGHQYEEINAPITSLIVTLVQDDGSAGSAMPWREIEPAYKEWVTLTMSAATAAQRGLTFTQKRCLPREATIRYNESKTATTRTIEVTLIPETVGVPAATVVKPEIPKVGDQPAVVPSPIPPPDMGLRTGQELVAGIGQFSLYRTSDFQTPSGSGGPTWEAVSLTGSDEILSWVVDPFSPGYLTGAGTIDGWAATDNAIYRIEDIFGATTCNAIVTFATTALWRTIQASFGTYFVTGSNPWLICISYYGNAGGHTGTWATYSMDGGATWSAEVLVSAFYDSGGASNPIGLYCSPKTPGLAYTIAHIATANPASNGGYVSHDWGATWTQMVGDDVATPTPYWGILNSGVCAVTAGPRVALSVVATAAHVSGSPVTDDPGTYYLLLAPPTNALRVRIEGTWTETRTVAGGTNFGVSYTGSLNNGNGTNANATTDTLSKATGATVNGAALTQDFVLEYTRAAGQTDWELSRDDMTASAPTVFTGYCYISFHAAASASLGRTATESLSITASVVEIELEDASVYVPTLGSIVPIHGQGGTIHLPWEGDDTESIFYYGALDRTSGTVYSLMRTSDDISPAAGYGIAHGHFAVRAHDSDRQLVLAAVHNGTNRAVYKSSNAGDTWSAVISPAAGAVPYSVAWSGALDDILFVWGPAQFIKYSDDAGASLDDRSGNLSGLSATKMIGIAGGPTP